MKVPHFGVVPLQNKILYFSVHFSTFFETQFKAKVGGNTSKDCTWYQSAVTFPPHRVNFQLNFKFQPFFAESSGEVVPLYQSTAVRGGIGVLPCNTTAPSESHPPILVIWYKNGGGDPVYRLVQFFLFLGKFTTLES